MLSSPNRYYKKGMVISGYLFPTTVTDYGLLYTGSHSGLSLGMVQFWRMGGLDSHLTHTACQCSFLAFVPGRWPCYAFRMRLLKAVTL